MLVDDRDVDIKLQMPEAFNMFKRYENSMPELKQTLVACVFNTKGLRFAKYWNEIGSKRGFNIRIFEDLESARSWLLSVIPD